MTEKQLEKNLVFALRGGYLTKQGGREGGRKSWKKRWFLLTDDKIQYFRTSEEAAKQQPPLGIIAYDDIVTVRPFETGEKGLYGFTIQTGSKALNIRSDDKLVVEAWRDALSALSELAKATREGANRVSSTHNYEAKLVVLANQMVIQGARLVGVCNGIQHSTSSGGSQQATSALLGPAIEQLVQAVVRAFRSPYNRTLTTDVCTRSKAILNLLSMVIQETIKVNKSGAPVITQKLKDEFLSTLKAVKEATVALFELPQPDPTVETSAAAAAILGSTQRLVTFAQDYAGPPQERAAQTAAWIKAVKDDMRQLFGLTNLCAAVASSPEVHKRLQGEAISLNYVIKDLLDAAVQPRTSTSLTVLSTRKAEVQKLVDEMLSLASKAYPPPPPPSPPPVVANGGQQQQQQQQQQSSRSSAVTAAPSAHEEEEHEEGAADTTARTRPQAVDSDSPAAAAGGAAAAAGGGAGGQPVVASTPPSPAAVAVVATVDEHQQVQPAAAGAAADQQQQQQPEAPRAAAAAAAAASPVVADPEPTGTATPSAAEAPLPELLLAASSLVLSVADKADQKVAASSSSVTCPLCEGKGGIDAFGPAKSSSPLNWRSCPLCEGALVLPASTRRLVKCAACNGLCGHDSLGPALITESDAKPCEKCSGKGYVDTAIVG